MNKKEMKMGMVSLVGALLLMLIPNNEPNKTGGQLEASNVSEVEKVSYLDKETAKEQEGNINIDEVERDEIEANDTEETNIQEDVDLDIKSQISEDTEPEKDNTLVSDSEQNNVRDDKSEANSATQLARSRSASSTNTSESFQDNTDKKESVEQEHTEVMEFEYEEEVGVEEEQTESGPYANIPNNSLFKDGKTVGTRIQGNRFTYTGNDVGLKYKDNAGNVHDVRLSNPIHIFPDGRDEFGRDRQAELEGYIPVIMNNSENGFTSYTIL